MKSLGYLFLSSFIFILTMCRPVFEPGSTEHIAHITSQVNDERLIRGDETPGDWITHGRNYNENRYSELQQINPSNIDSLGLAWTLVLGTKRGVEATPLVVDGIMFLTGPWSIVYAVDTRKGALIWTYDPKVPGKFGEKACCDVVNRGLAIYKGSVYVGTIDGRLISIDAATGLPRWEVFTVDTSKNYSITKLLSFPVLGGEPMKETEDINLRSIVWYSLQDRKWLLRYVPLTV